MTASELRRRFGAVKWAAYSAKDAEEAIRAAYKQKHGADPFCVVRLPALSLAGPIGEVRSALEAAGEQQARD